MLAYMTEPMQQYVFRSLQNLNRSSDLVAVEKATGVSRWTLQKIASGGIKNSRSDTLQPVHDYFRRLESLAQARKLRTRAA